MGSKNEMRISAKRRIRMTRNNSVLPRIVDSVLGALPVVGSGAQNLYDAWHQNKTNIAREVILSNIRQGDITAIEQDELLNILARFSRSVYEGIAKRNLILLARLISGMGKFEQQKCRSNMFARYANMLEYLDVDELKYLADFISYYSKPSKNRPLWNMEEIKLQENPLADVLLQKGVFGSGFEVWQEENDDWKNPSKFPSDIRTKLTYYLSADMQDIVNKYGIDWVEIANMEI